ncbi:MAG: two component regulator three y domain-containing protein [Cyclobacteriaceae bacterium]|nr:two component regulator three y domain-containing protein [Cyclobacteriaceae bacterium]MCH8515133.1 two component regulator three y domain-containing protein [Cyclobacteriaceae bacterium]
MKIIYQSCVLLLLSVTTVWGQFKSPGLPFSTYFSSQDYQGGIQNWTITQGTEGIIYVANNFGLLEYDGLNWSRHILGLGVKCRDVCIGDNGLIYVAGQGDFGFFSPDERGTLEYISLADKLPNDLRNFDETWRIFVLDGMLYFCTFDEIFVFDSNHQFHAVVSPNDRPENFYLVNDQIFVNQPAIGLTKLIGNELKPLDGGGFLAGKRVSGIIPIEKDKLLIATINHGIYIMDNSGFQPWSTNYHEVFQQATVNTMIRLQNGNIAIGTQNDGLYLFDRYANFIRQLNKDSGIENRTVLSLFEDRNSNLWLGHNNGISLVELALPFTHINEHSGLPGTGYAATIHDGQLYFGTNNGVYVQNLNHNQQNNFELIENTSGQVYSFFPLGDELIMGHHFGTFSIKNQKAQSISSIPGSWMFIDLDSHPDYVLQGNYSGLAIFEKTADGLVFSHRIEGFSESSRVMIEDVDDGGVWMTHGYKGVYKLFLSDDLQSVEYRYFTHEDGLPGNRLINVRRLGNQILFTTEAGIYQFDTLKDRFVPYTALDRYIPRETLLVSLDEDDMGNIFYVSLTGIGFLKKKTDGSYQPINNLFNRLDLLLNDDLQFIMSPEVNQVLFAAKEGFIHFDDRINYDTNLDFQTIIRQVAISGNEDSIVSFGRYQSDGAFHYSQPEEVKYVFSFQQNSISFEFAAPFMTGNDLMDYQFFLENLEKDYSEWTQKTIKEYTQLKEGTYTFRVRARNIYHHISQEARFTFVILPPWYRTQWAYGLYVSLLLIVGLMVFVSFEARYRRKTVRITQAKEKEINAKELELKSSEKEIERLKSDKLQAEIEAKNKELATSTMHLINKNGFINSVKSSLNVITKKSKNEEVKAEIHKIIKNIDKNIASDHDWEQFEVHFDQVHGDFARRLKEAYPDLSPQEMKLSAYLRLNLSTKEIAYLLNISTRGVEIARYRLRKKLGLERSVNLQEFILAY